MCSLTLFHSRCQLARTDEAFGKEYVHIAARTPLKTSLLRQLGHARPIAQQINAMNMPTKARIASTDQLCVGSVF